MRNLTAISLAMFASSAVAAEIDFSYENFYRTQTGAVEIVLKFTNNTNRTISIITADCALLGDDRKALTVIPVIAQNVPAGGTAVANNYGPSNLPVEHADCRIRDYR